LGIKQHGTLLRYLRKAHKHRIKAHAAPPFVQQLGDDELLGTAAFAGALGISLAEVHRRLKANALPPPDFVDEISNRGGMTKRFFWRGETVKDVALR
jgi:hypothetical protein